MNDKTTMTTEDIRTQRIRELNDALRTTWTSANGEILVTQGIMQLSDEDRRDVLTAVKTFSDFTEDNDPYGEHDFGAFTKNAHRIFWKIDYYAPDMMHGSEDPADPAQTRRVMTIMLASEY